MKQRTVNSVDDVWSY